VRLHGQHFTKLSRSISRDIPAGDVASTTATDGPKLDQTAVLVRPDVLRSRSRSALQDAERIHELLAAAAAESLPAEGGLTAQRAEELIAEIRAGRERR